MKLAAVRRFALALPEVAEAPHHDYSSYRVRGKIFVTIPPSEERIHVFVSEAERQRAIAMYPEWAEKLLWGGKVVGVRVALASAAPAAVQTLVRAAWQFKAPAALLSGEASATAPRLAPGRSARKPAT